MKNRFLLLSLILLWSTHLFAEGKLPSIITDNMVLQQNQEVVLWGWESPGKVIEITGSWNNKTYSTKIDTSGKWEVKIKTPFAGGPYTITFKGDDEITLDNVMIGEVWLASGQSNMHFPLGKTERYWATGVANYQKELLDTQYPDIRLFNVDQTVAQDPANDVKGHWQMCDSQTAQPFSAVAFMYARELYNTLRVPIGIISSSWGGTPAESWTKKEVLMGDEDFTSILDDYEKKVEAYPEAYEKWSTSYKRWQDGVASGKITGSKAKRGPREPIGPNHNKSPYKLYNGMINPLIPYTIKGVIWYQGESNAVRAYQYRKLFPAMIKNWRDDWQQGDFPFYFVQITPNQGQNAEIREAQLMTMLNVPNTGMVVTTDIGNKFDIHPRNKQQVAERLAFWALNKTYGFKDVAYSGPIYKSMEKKGEVIELSFDYAEQLFCDGDSLFCFIIAGKDSVFVQAKAKIIRDPSGDKIHVWSSDVNQPLAVRFAWNAYMRPNLYNSEYLPASPFRTDNWEDKYPEN
jgi:sialate O-acetylesterase